MAQFTRTANFGSSNDSSCVLSFWIKKTKNETVQGLFLGWNGSTNYATCYVNNDDTIYYKEKQGGTQYETRITSGARKFRDINAWYHFVFQWDYAQATASNRIKVWINGELQTWENTGNLPPQNNSLRLKISDFRIGTYTADGSTYYDWQGLMSHVHFIDDATYNTYQASTFGETDSTTGEWKINVSPTISDYGPQGFFILKNDNLGTDRSGKGNNLTANGTITKTEDCPSNVFCTLNSLVNGDGSYSLTNGNNKFTGTGPNDHTFGTLGAIGGKFYYETKWVTNPDKCFSGFTPAQLASNLGPTEVPVSKMSGLYRDDYFINVGDVNEGAYTNVSAGDIFGFAIDLSSSSGSRTLKTYKNGSLINTMTLSTSYENDIWLPVVGDTSSTDGVIECNFGNGYFGTTAVSSAGTNASNNGIFEYDVPAGYTALSTKGLNL